MIKLLIFDLDGTLLDTTEDLANSLNFALKRQGFPILAFDEYSLLINKGIDKVLETVLPVESRDADRISMLKVDFINHYYSHSDAAAKPYTGITELIRKLYAGGFKLAVASNKAHLATVQLVQRFFPDIEFTSVYGKRDGHPVKPNGGVLKEIIQTAGVEISESLYIGDSGLDVATAYNAKVVFIGVLWGTHSKKDLEEVGANCFAESTYELDAIIQHLFKPNSESQIE